MAAKNPVTATTVQTAAKAIREQSSTAMPFMGSRGLPSEIYAFPEGEGDVGPLQEELPEPVEQRVRLAGARRSQEKGVEEDVLVPDCARHEEEALGRL